MLFVFGRALSGKSKGVRRGGWLLAADLSGRTRGDVGAQVDHAVLFHYRVALEPQGRQVGVGLDGLGQRHRTSALSLIHLLSGKAYSANYFAQTAFSRKFGFDACLNLYNCSEESW
jgi:hypothetical protein